MHGWVPFHRLLGTFGASFCDLQHGNEQQSAIYNVATSSNSSRYFGLIMRIVFPLLFAVAAFVFGQEPVVAEDSRELSAALSPHGRFHGFSRPRGFSRGFGHGRGHGAAAQGGGSDETNRLLLAAGRQGRGHGAAAQGGKSNVADETNRLLLAAGRHGRGRGRSKRKSY
ncbi:unnamed protein product, partial [Aphanomyces euteiches]